MGKTSNSISILSETTKQFIKDDLRQGNFELRYLSDVVKELIKASFHRIGLEVRRAPLKHPSTKPPPIFDDPMKAVYYQRDGKPAAFHCPIEKCIINSGFSHAQEGWHPFSATLEEYRDKSCHSYESSLLKKFYETWQPQTALEVLIGCRNGPSALKGYPPQDYILPWSGEELSEPTGNTSKGILNRNTSNRINNTQYINFIENVRRYGGNPSHTVQEQIDIDLWGHLNYGPQKRLKGEFEYARLVHVYNSICKRGYDRSEGDLGGFVPIKRGNELKFIIRDGHHRVAAMKALGCKTVPATLDTPKIIDVAEVDYWPQVCCGVWDRTSAIQYVNHLFDFDSRAWASEHGLRRKRKEVASKTL